MNGCHVLAGMYLLLGFLAQYSNAPEWFVQTLFIGAWVVNGMGVMCRALKTG